MKSVLLTPLADERGVVILQKKKLREGYTTGSCAAAAAQAAVLAARGETIAVANVLSPQQAVIPVPIAWAKAIADGGQACVIKDGGDDPDITHGTDIVVTVTFTEQTGITIKAGEGVGTVTKPGLAAPVGEPAVNPGPQIMIHQAVEAVLPPEAGAVVTISVPKGAVLAKKTLNPILGIEGGISILGTTGIVRPMSEQAFKDSLTPQISVVQALGYDTAVFVPGWIGQEVAVQKLGIGKELVVQTSNFIGHMLEKAAEYELKKVLLVGHLGKIVKVAAGVFHTHNRIADARMETLAAYGAACGASRETVQEILACSTTEAAMPIIKEQRLEAVYSVIAQRASLRARAGFF